ncbi:hypothetical protein [Dechloromonas sp. HYN0024]|uniref:hypothetical protein n=1 Tax=Dechloromonas sp. HYN0024 TaxID=2231055 RepID=UPI0013C2DDC8|nr:hypothetical protein [Dechloromonas sp. HYN0024]
MKDLQAPVSHDFSPKGLRAIFNHIPRSFRRAFRILAKIPDGKAASENHLHFRRLGCHQDLTGAP